ncbi:TetR/AcrR family transcriptional regulator C-terminal domain-containing protein [Streptococcus pasteurianus]|uniref:TetR/AcrR family transcriptional regulator C-terminal domain-containing protein n=1 Tax=Streptococcus pasteurianus TaxID=197614 RepID=UPI003013967E
MTTKKLIQKQFIEEYAKKEYDHITVKELCANTPVARTTFYSYYQNIDDVKEDTENNLLIGITEIAVKLSKGNMPKMDFSLFLSETMEYIKQHWHEIYVFLVVQPNMRFIVKWKEAIKKHFLLRFPQKAKVPNYEMISETVASAVIGAYSYWLKNPEKVDIDRLNKIVIAVLHNSIDLI